MAEALAGVRPEATAATPVVEAAAAQARKGPVAMAGSQKNRAASQRSSGAALKRRSSKRTTHASTNLPRERILWDAVFAPGVSKQAGGLVMRIMTLVLYVGALPQSPTQREPDRPWKRNSHRPDSRYSAVTPWLGLG